MIRPGHDGFLFPPGDTGTLVDHLTALADREKRSALGRIARLTGTPVAKLQDWNGLACLLGAATLSAGLAGLVLHWAPWSTFARLVAAGAIVALAYPVALRLFGQFHQLTHFFASLRNKAPA